MSAEGKGLITDHKFLGCSHEPGLCTKYRGDTQFRMCHKRGCTEPASAHADTQEPDQKRGE